MIFAGVKAAGDGVGAVAGRHCTGWPAARLVTEHEEKPSCPISTRLQP
ncbi:hypothetical protein ABTZ58_38140 [Streptomyces sp. NPDC094143]